MGGDELTIHESAVVGAATVESTSVIPGDHAKRSQLASPVTALAQTVLPSLALVVGDWQVQPTAWLSYRAIALNRMVTLAWR